MLTDGISLIRYQKFSLKKNSLITINLSMKQAIFITGFNNWGKTSLINKLFNNRKRYHYGWFYTINGINAKFTVESHSNDDYWGQSWVDLITSRIKAEQHQGLNLITALCPTIHDNNNFIKLLNSPVFSYYSKLNVVLIEYKYEHHAKLIIPNIINIGQSIPNVNFITINADQNLATDQLRWSAKTNQLLHEITNLFP